MCAKNLEERGRSGKHAERGEREAFGGCRRTESHAWMKTFMCSGPYPIGAGPGPGPGLWNGTHRYPARSFQPGLSKPLSWPSTTWCGQALIHPKMFFVAITMAKIFGRGCFQYFVCYALICYVQWQTWHKEMHTVIERHTLHSNLDLFGTPLPTNNSREVEHSIW